jgi:CMP-N-acetylneuraminic acid synthetase
MYPSEKWRVQVSNTVTAIVPVRRGSERVKGKNLKAFVVDGGVEHSLLSWKLEQLTQALGAQSVLVSTDWDEVLEVAQTFGCRTHERTPALAASDAPFDQVILEVVGQVETEHVMWAPVTSPFMGAEVVLRMWAHYLELSPEVRARGLIAAHRLRSYCLMAGRPINFPVGSGHVQTQDIAPVDVFDWGLSIRPTVDVLAHAYMFSGQPEIFEVTPLENFDINDMLEFQMAQTLVPLYRSLSGSSS